MYSRDSLDEQLVAATRKNAVEEVRALIEKRANVHYSDYVYQDTALKVAASEGYHEIVKLLLDAGAEANTCSRNGFITNPLYFAIMNGHTEVVRVMLSSKFYKVDVNTYFYHSITPLKYAVQSNHLEIVQLLLAARADVKQGYSSSNGISALSCAAGNKDLACARELIAAGADVNAYEVCGFRPLHAAAEHGDFELVKLLVENGADIMAENTFRDSAANEASKNGHLHIVNYLRTAFDEQEKAKAQAKSGFSALPAAMFTPASPQAEVKPAPQVQNERTLSH